MGFPRKVLAVFAHPDDESFGPGGTLGLWAEQSKLPEEVDEKIDVSSVWEKRILAMDQHLSQKKDIDEIKKELEMGNKEEWFMVRG